MNIFLKAALSVTALAFATTAVAQDKFSYETDGFYIKANTREDIRIGTTNGAKLTSDEPGSYKVDVKLIKLAATPKGYSKKLAEIADADFILSDDHTEMMVEDRGEGKEILRALIWQKGDIGIKVFVANDSLPQGFKPDIITLPDAERQTMSKAITK